MWYSSGVGMVDGLEGMKLRYHSSTTLPAGCWITASRRLNVDILLGREYYHAQVTPFDPAFHHLPWSYGLS